MKDIKELEILMDNKTKLACACTLFSRASEILIQAQFCFADMWATDECTKEQMLTYRNKMWEMSDELKSMSEELVKIQKKIRMNFRE